jgi:hypothetical protein
MIPANDNQKAGKADSAVTPLAMRLFRAGRADDLSRYIRYGTIVTVPAWLSAESDLPEAGSKMQAARVTETRPSPDKWCVWPRVMQLRRAPATARLRRQSWMRQ